MAVSDFSYSSNRSRSTAARQSPRSSTRTPANYPMAPKAGGQPPNNPKQPPQQQPKQQPQVPGQKPDPWWFGGMSAVENVVKNLPAYLRAASMGSAPQVTKAASNAANWAYQNAPGMATQAAKAASNAAYSFANDPYGTLKGAGNTFTAVNALGGLGMAAAKNPAGFATAVGASMFPLYSQYKLNQMTKGMPDYNALNQAGHKWQQQQDAAYNRRMQTWSDRLTGEAADYYSKPKTTLPTTPQGPGSVGGWGYGDWGGWGGGGGGGGYSDLKSWYNGMIQWGINQPKSA